MGYINHSFVIRVAVLGGALSLLPLPVLARILDDDALTATAQLNLDANQTETVDLNAANDALSSSDDVFLPAVIVSAASPAFVEQSSMDYGKSQLTQVSQLPTLSKEESAGELESAEPLPDVAEVKQLSDSVERDVDESSLIEDDVAGIASLPSGESVAETSQSETFADDDWVSESTLPPVDVLVVLTSDFVDPQPIQDDGISQLPEVSQLPTLPTDESADQPEGAEPLTDESETEELGDEVELDVDESLPIEDTVDEPASQESGDIVPDTGQAESTANDDLLSESDLPPQELLADPNPLTVPTLESEVFLPEGDAQTIDLEEAIELSYFNNQDLQAALLELEQSEAVLDEARAAFLPTVAGSADVTTTEATGSSSLNPLTFEFETDGGDGLDTRLNADLQVNYDVFTSGQRSATLQAAKEQVRLSELEVDRRREELRLNTTTLYYDLQESGEQIRINQAFVDEAARNRRDNALRQEAGVGTTFDVLRADVQLANAQQDLIQAQAQQRIARRNLARLLNLPSTVNINAAPVPTPESWEATYDRWELTLEDSILLAFQGRAELEQQLAQREISTQQARAARAATRPQVNLFANYSLSDLLDDSSDNYAFGARLNWVFVDGGAARARARQQEANADIAEERFAEILDQVRFEVEQAYFTMRSNEENVRTARTAITQAVRALELANLRLDAGVGTQLDVLTAQSELTQAEGNWVSAALGYSRAFASLQRAVSNLRSTL